MDSITKCILRALCIGIGALAGCAGIGPHTLTHDRFDYTEAIATSWKQQMLVNIVKLRYGDTPVFLEVASVINQYAVEGQVDLRFAWVDPVVTVGNSQAVGGAARYSDKPTITYTPLTGERFARSLMKPIPPPALLSLIQAGYPVDIVLRICVHSVNGIRNRYGGSVRTQLADPEFYPLLQRMRRIQNSGALGWRIQKTTETEGLLMAFRKNVEPSVQEDMLIVRKTLGLDPNAQEFRIVYGSVANDNKEVAMLTRSMLEILVNLGACVEVPATDVQERRTTPMLPQESVGGVAVPSLISIRSSPRKPPDALIAVPYRSHWFWIDDRDMQSKTLFSFLMFVFSLTETEGREGAPIVTIPAG